jgi:hypothetical protein
MSMAHGGASPLLNQWSSRLREREQNCRQWRVETFRLAPDRRGGACETFNEARSHRAVIPCRRPRPGNPVTSRKFRGWT